MGSGLAGGPLTGGPAAAPSLLPGATGTDLTLTGTLQAATVTATGTSSALAVTATGTLTAGTSLVVGSGGTTAASGTKLNAGVADGAAAISGYSNNTVTLSNATARLWIFFNNAAERASVHHSGRIDIQGTDSTGTPGNATINEPTGKSSIALGAASVTITNNLCAATSRVMFSPHARDATCVDLIVVPGAGSFVVSGAAAATADLPFSWEVSNLL